MSTSQQHDEKAEVEQEKEYLEKSLEIAIDSVKKAWDEGHAAKKSATNPYEFTMETAPEDT